MKPIAILGCGPAGLLAAHAVGLAGYPFAIISKPEKSRLGGAQYLHMAIPMVTSDEPHTTIKIKTEGDAETYRRKVYGDDPTVPFVSFPKEVESEQKAWNLQDTYDKLWAMLGESVTPADLGPAWLDEHAIDFDIIINTIPMAYLCRARTGELKEIHNFNAQKVWVAEDDIRQLPDDTMLYDGTTDRAMYRCSRIFGQGSTEWSDNGPKPPLPNLRMLLKPIKTNCTCFPDVIRVGRHGSWTKGVLTHHAFIEALKLVLPPREVEEAVKR